VRWAASSPAAPAVAHQGEDEQRGHAPEGELAGASGSDGSCGNSSASCCASAARPQRLRSDLALPQFAGCPGRIGLQACFAGTEQQAGMPILLRLAGKLGEGKRSDCLTSASNRNLMEVFLPPASGFLGVKGNEQPDGAAPVSVGNVPWPAGSRRTEQAYIHWIRRFILFHNLRRATRCAIPLPPICWRTVTTSGPCRSFWGTRTSRPRWFTGVC